MHKIMAVAQIRSIVDSCFTEEDLHNGNYFDVIEKIEVPSDDGNYSEYNAVAVVTSKQAEFIKGLFEGDPKIAYICIQLLGTIKCPFDEK